MVKVRGWSGVVAAMMAMSAVTFIVASRNSELSHPNLRTQESTECAGIQEAITQYNASSLDWSPFDDSLTVAKVEAEATYSQFPQAPVLVQLVGDITDVQHTLVAERSADPSSLVSDCGLLVQQG
jgi:hypothetical protein